jgi:hypothetical protein
MKVKVCVVLYILIYFGDVYYRGGSPNVTIPRSQVEERLLSGTFPPEIYNDFGYDFC